MFEKQFSFILCPPFGLSFISQPNFTFKRRIICINHMYFTSKHSKTFFIRSVLGCLCRTLILDKTSRKLPIFKESSVGMRINPGVKKMNRLKALRKPIFIKKMLFELKGIVYFKLPPSNTSILKCDMINWTNLNKKGQNWSIGKVLFEQSSAKALFHQQSLTTLKNF